MGGRLVLWDIDHTLIDADGMGGEAYREAFRRTTGRALEQMVAMAGRTDLAIMGEVLTLHGVEPTRRVFTAFAEALAAAFAVRATALAERGRRLRGAVEALTALRETPGVVQSVLTGNIRPLAVGKLAAFGLDHLVDVDVGAYGSDDAVRANLVRIARRRVREKHGLDFNASTTVLIGDTPNDVAAGRVGGAAVVAVATGASSVAELRAAGADVVLPDLADTPALLEAVLGNEVVSG